MRSPSTPARVARVASDSNACDEFRPAVRIAGVVERVHADDDVAGAEHLGPAEREREKDRVSRRHVGRTGCPAAARSRSCGHRRHPTSATSRRTRADRSSARGAARRRALRRRPRAAATLARVPLAVADRQRVQLEPVRLRDGGGGVRIEAAARGQHDRLRSSDAPRVCGCQMNLCSWSCSRAGSRSASIHSESAFGSSTP